ncbi:hypothetical protein [Treponema sp.]|uniref:hypothetical protein n=1 Tax=Treponema sp. TaxID=166 RepID=UPI00298D65FD|nr:hypothetical protein [Treponema sp.]MCQ2241866.1 hypothetical protein [Treponema sp.]
MNLKVLSLMYISLFLFASCVSHANGDNSAGSTLKATATSLDSTTAWTETLDGEILSEKYSEAKGISTRLNASVEMFPLSEVFLSSENVYPRISEAYSLDTSRLPEHGYKVLDDFMSAFEKGENLETYFETSSIYSLVMFKYDFERLYGDMKVSWHAIGEPFCGEGYFQCPVRFFFGEEKNYNGSHADAMIFLRNSESGCRIISVDLISQTGE